MRPPKPRLPRTSLRAIARIAATVGLSLALLAPAAAQFWPFGGQQRQPQRQQPQQRQQQQQYNPFGNWFGKNPGRRQSQAPVDSSRAPNPARRSAESTAAITTPIVVMGDSMADWLAYGLEDALADKPEFGVVRRHRTGAGLVRYDPRRDVEWPQMVRETIAAEKPKFIVMMIGYHDRQTIRERPATAPATPARRDAEDQEDPESPESRAKASAEAQNAEMRRAAQQKAQARPQPPAPTGPMEFQTENWQTAYIKRIDATIAAMRGANVPVIWVGLPPQRNARAAQDAVYLNELFRSRAERAGIVYVDVWDGFVDESGRYELQGPDVDGQTRRLRSGDTVYFTKAGARKLAHYVEREIQRAIVNRALPVSLPAPEPAVASRSGAARPIAGPVIPLTAAGGGGNELLGGGVSRALPVDPVANRVLIRGEAIAAPAGRTDNFIWPPGGATALRAPAAAIEESAVPEKESASTDEPEAAAPTSAPAAQPKRAPTPRARTEAPAKAEPKRPAPRRPPPRANNTVPRPPGAIAPSASRSKDGVWR